LSLGSTDYLRLAPIAEYGHSKRGEISVKLEDKSIYILEGISRYEWKHGIGRIHEGKCFKGEDFMRISLTFRDVIESRRKL
jgi:alkylated DNA repair dioxygenase AlkB